MQHEIQNNQIFSERSETLSARVGIKLSDLPDFIGISRAMFHSYRSGKHPISAKAWRKLETAERSAGLQVPPASDPGGSAIYPPPALSSRIYEPAQPYADKPRTIEDRLESIETRLARLDSVESLLVKLLDKIAPEGRSIPE